MSFSIVASATAVAGAVLGIGWLFFGSLLLRRWGLEPNPKALLVGRRLGTTYVSIALLLALGRSAPPSELRHAVSVGLLCAMVILASLGLFEYKAGRAKAGILISVGIEVVLALGFAWIVFVGT